MTDVTDATFQTAVLERSKTVPVIVDLWAPWCQPCTTLGPIIEKVVAETNGEVELAKVNIDENPGVAQAFRVQSIPAVFALRDGQVVDSFIGSLPEREVRVFIEGLAPGTSELAGLIEAGDEKSLKRALELDPDSTKAASKLADIWVGEGRLEEAETFLRKFPEVEEIAKVLAKIRLVNDGIGDVNEASLEDQLQELLATVKSDEVARQRYVDLLTMFPEGDPRIAQYRKALTSRLF